MKTVDRAQASKGKVFCYARWSSVGQTLGTSEERQLEAAQAFAEGKGLKLSDDVYEDRGVSAWHGKHRKSGALCALLGRAEPGDAIVINSYSRWSREHPLDGLEALRQTTDKGVTVHFTTAGMSVSQVNFKQLLPMLTLLASMANGENDERSYNIRKAMATKQQNLKAGKATFGRLPAWLGWSCPARPRREDRRVVVLEDKAALVRKVFALCLEGKGVHQIEHAMRAHPPIANSRKADWNTSFLHRLLTDRAVLGFHAGSDKPVYPAIIDADTFHAAKAKLAQRRSWTVRESVENSNLFTKLARCAECGSPLVKQTTRVNDRAYSYLMCGGAIRHKTKCNGGTIRYSVFEENLLGLLTQDAAIRAALTSEAPVASKLDALQGELAGVNKEQNKLMAMIDGMDNPPRQLADKLNALNARETALQDDIEAETTKAKFVTPPLKAYQEWRAGQTVPTVEIDRAKVRVLLRDIVDRIEVKLGKDEYAVYFKGGRKPFGVQIWSAE